MLGGMEGERESILSRHSGESADAALAALRQRVGEMRIELLRLRASRRTLMALVEMQGRQKALLEARLERLRTRLRAERRRRRAVGAASADGC